MPYSEMALRFFNVIDAVRWERTVACTQSRCEAEVF